MYNINIGAKAKRGLPGPRGPRGRDGADGHIGADGKEVELRNNNTHIQWRYIGDTTWKDLVSVASLVGADGVDGKDGKDGKDGTDGTNGADGKDGNDGVNGSDGADGREIELDNDGTHIRWRYAGGSWSTLASIASLKGDKGDAATVSVGSTTTGGAGTSAVVSNSGTNVNATLDFTIPRGDRGADGSDGKEVELQNNGTYIQWRYEGDTWQNLVSIASITGSNGADGEDGVDGTNGADGKDGNDGVNGSDGADGREIELDNDGTHIRWRYVGGSWNNLILVSSLKGDKGDKGDSGAGVPQGGSNGQLLVKDGGTDYVTKWETPDYVNKPVGATDGDVLTYDNGSWIASLIDTLPDQTGNDGKVLGTDGTVASWVAGGDVSKSRDFDIIVDANGGGDFTTLSGALSSLSSGNKTILVRAGTYTETLSLSYDYVEIVGEGAGQTIITLDGDSTLAGKYLTIRDMTLHLDIYALDIVGIHPTIKNTHLTSSGTKQRDIFRVRSTTGGPYALVTDNIIEAKENGVSFAFGAYARFTNNFVIHGTSDGYGIRVGGTVSGNTFYPYSATGSVSAIQAEISTTIIGNVFFGRNRLASLIKHRELFDKISITGNSCFESGSLLSFYGNGHDSGTITIANNIINGNRAAIATSTNNSSNTTPAKILITNNVVKASQQSDLINVGKIKELIVTGNSMISSGISGCHAIQSNTQQTIISGNTISNTDKAIVIGANSANAIITGNIIQDYNTLLDDSGANTVMTADNIT